MDRAGGPADVLRFGAFELDVRSGELYRGGRKVRLQEQPFQVLLVLLERCGRIVTRDELREIIWPDHTFVDFDHAIRTAINKVRDALDDRAENPRFVETIPKHGYRFIAPVVRGGVAALASVPSVSPAEAAYQKGSYALRRSVSGVVAGIEHFRECIERDPNHAQAYVGLALLHLQMGFGFGPLTPGEAFAEARRAALQALRLDAALAEAIGCLAWVRSFGEWQWQAAEREFHAALQVNPAAAEVHRLYSWHLSAMGRSEQAIEHSIRARDLDPVSLQAAYSVAAAYWWSRQYDLAVGEMDRLAQMDPTFPGAQRLAGGVYTQTHRYEEAIAALERANVLNGKELSPWGVAHLAHAYAVAGREAKSRELFEWLERRLPAMYVSPYLMAFVSACLHDVDGAFRWLEQGFTEKNPMLAFLRVDPLFDNLRADARFQDVIARMKFPS